MLILKYIIKNELNRELNNIIKEMKSRLDLNIPKKLVFLLVLVYQNTFIFMLLLIISNLNNQVLINWILGISCLFNIILPSTIARNLKTKVEESPVLPLLITSGMNKKRAQNTVVLTELIDFWIHNGTIEAISMWIFIIKFRIYGLFLAIPWIILVSIIFVLTVYKQNGLNMRCKSSIILYVFELIISIIISINMFKICIISINKISIKNIYDAQMLKSFSENYIKEVVSRFSNLLYDTKIYIGIFVLTIMYICFKKLANCSFCNEISKSILSKSKQSFIFYNNIFFKNIFVKRDIKIIFNIMKKIDINEFFIIIPSGITFVVGTYLLYLFNSYNGYVILIALDFILWISMYRFCNYIITKVPIFHISSECRNIDLIKFSKKYTYKDLIISKHILLLLFSSPIILTVIIEKFILAISYNLSMVVIALSLINSVFIFLACIFVVLRWTIVAPNFSYENIFMIKQDSFDNQIVKQFMQVPVRMITIFLSVSFTFVNIVQVEYNRVFISIFYILSYLVIVSILVAFAWRKKYEFTR